MVCASPVGRSISSHALEARLKTLDDLVVVDVRSPSEWLSGRIPGSLGLPKPDLESALNQAGAPPLPKDRDIVLVCQSGLRSSAMIKALAAAGYDSARLYNLEQGMAGWRGAVHRPDVENHS